MLNQDQYELLQSFVTMPDPTHAEMFALQGEIEELTESIEVKAAEYESLQEHVNDLKMDIAEGEERINELECALADALSWIAGDTLPSDLAETDKAFGKLYKVL